MPTKTVILLLISLPLVALSHAQSATVDVEVTLLSPGPACTFAVNNDLNFGSVEKPATGSGSVTISATTGARSSSGAVATGTSTVGQVRLLGQHVANYTVSRTFPASLTNNSASLTFAGTWAHSTSASSNYTALTSTSYTGTAGGLGSSFSHYFRFGGTVSDIEWADNNGSYTESISTSATCN